MVSVRAQQHVTKRYNLHYIIIMYMTCKVWLNKLYIIMKYTNSLNYWWSTFWIGSVHGCGVPLSEQQQIIGLVNSTRNYTVS